MPDEHWLDEQPFYTPTQCAIPHCIDPIEKADLCTLHLAEFKEWLRRKAWREANGVTGARRQG